MANFRQQGFGSKLLRRVQRHRAMTALFRSPVEPETPAYEAQPTGQNGMPVVLASLALPQALPETESPVLQAAPRPLPPITRPPQAPAPFVPAPLPNTVATPQTPVAPVQRQAVTSPTRAMATAMPEPAVPEPGAEESDTAITEDVWRRLTTISRKHREKQAEEAELDAQQVDSAEIFTSPPTQPRPERGIVEMPSRKAEPSPVQRAPVVQSNAEPVVDELAMDKTGEASDGSPLPEAAMPVNQQASPEPAPAILRAPEAEQPATTTIALTPAEPEAAVPPVVQRQIEPAEQTDARETAQVGVMPERPDTERPEAVERHIETEPVTVSRTQENVVPTAHSETASPRAIQRSEAPTESSESDDVDEAPAPLEQALAAGNAFGFQVKRTTPATVQAQPAVKQLPPAPRPVKATDHQELHTTLQNVESGRPTDSSIEVIPPRRPRPENVMHAPRILRRPQANALPAEEGGMRDRVALNATEAETPPLVETPIGPLPSDLWTLIDAPVPQTAPPLSATQPVSESRTRSAPPQVQARVSTQPPAASATPVQRAIHRAEAPATPAGDQPTAQTVPAQAAAGIPRIQRAVSVEQVESQVEERPAGDTAQAPTESLATSQSETQQEQTPTAGETDLDALAVQVYQRLKRKLNIEWERLRSRF